MPEQKFTNVLEWRASNPSATVQVNEKVSKSIADVVAKENAAITVQERGTESTNRRVTAYADEAEVARKLGLSLEQLGVKADAAQQGDVTSVSKQLDVERQITAEMEKQIAANDRAARGSVGSFGGADGKLTTGFGTLRAAGSAFSNLGGGSGLTQAVSFAGLFAELGAVGIVAGTAAVALKVLNAEQERQGRVVAARLDAERSAAREVGSLTTAAINERINTAKQQLAIDQEISRQQLANSVLYNLSIVDQPLKLAAALGGLDPVYNAYQEAVAKNTVVLEADQAAINVYTDALDSNSAAAANAAAAAQALTEAQIRNSELTVEADRMTAEQREKRAGELAREIELLFELQQSGDVTGDTILELNDQIQELNTEYQSLIGVTKSYGDALEYAREKQDAIEQATKDAADAATARNDQYLDALEREATARDKAADIQARITELAEGRDTRLLELQADFEDRRTEVVAEGEDKRLETAKEAANRLAKVERDAGRSRAEAIGNRDANAFRLANLRASDAAEDAKEASDKQAEAAQKAQDKTLINLQKSYDKQVQSTVSAANKQITVQQAALAEQLFLAEQARSNQTFLAASTATTVVGYHNKMYTDMSTAAYIGGQNAVQSFMNGVNSRLGGAYGGGSSGFPTLTASIGAAQPGGQAQFDKLWDKRMSQTIVASRGGRTLIP